MSICYYTALRNHEAYISVLLFNAGHDLTPGNRVSFLFHTKSLQNGAVVVCIFLGDFNHCCHFGFRLSGVDLRHRPEQVEDSSRGGSSACSLDAQGLRALRSRNRRS